MGWITLSLRKHDLQANIQELELRDLELSRELRGDQRTLSYEQSVFAADKAEEMKGIKEAFWAVRDQRPLREQYVTYEEWRNEYEAWSVRYEKAKEEYEESKMNCENFYDDANQQLEEEATEKETQIQEEQATVEAQLEAVRAELESINETISSDIQQTAIKL